jgi:hypothetical protein
MALIGKDTNVLLLKVTAVIIWQRRTQDEENSFQTGA